MRVQIHIARAVLCGSAYEISVLADQIRHPFAFEMDVRSDRESHRAAADRSRCVAFGGVGVDRVLADFP